MNLVEKGKGFKEKTSGKRRKKRTLVGKKEEGKKRILLGKKEERFKEKVDKRVQFS